MHKRKLTQIAETISELIDLVPRIRGSLDFTLGGAYALLRADALGFKDRPQNLPDKYWVNLKHRARRMAQQCLPQSGPWLAGFYFNSALMRIAAAYDRIGNERVSSNIGSRRGRTLLRQIDGRLRDGKGAKAVREEVNRLKHVPTGVQHGRSVNINEAIKSLDELIRIVSDNACQLQ